MSTPNPSPHPIFAPDQKLAGTFILRRQLPSDGPEQVWLAQDELLGKDVSLHFLPEILRGDERSMSELRTEIKRTRQLIHPGILRVYDLVEEAEWSAISMDCFEGESLAARLRQRAPGALNPEDLEGTLRQVCQTLDDVHRIQVVHRNLNPQNILVDESGKVLLAKFGVSRAIDDALGRLQKQEAGERHLSYITPQQLDGEPPNKLDDIYALGASLHELLTGQPPFTGADLVAQIRRSTPPAIGEARAKLAQPSAAVPPAWEKAVAACLSKDPAQRPQTAGEVAVRLDLGSAAKSVPARPAAQAAAPAAAAAVAAAVPPATPEVPSEAPPVDLEKPVPETPKRSPEPEPARERTAQRSDDFDDLDNLDSPYRDESEEKSSGVPEIYPDLYPKHSKSSSSSLVLVGLILAAGAAVYYFATKKEPEKPESGQVAAVQRAVPANVTPTPEILEKPSSAEIAQAKSPASPGSTTDLVLGEPRLENLPAPATPKPAVEVPPSAEPPLPTGASPTDPLLLADRGKTPVKKPATPEPAETKPPEKMPTASAPPIAVPVVPTGVMPVDQAQQVLAATEKAMQDAAARKKSEDEALAASEKGLADRTKSAAAVLKAAEELQTQRQKHELTFKTAEAAARDSRQAAEEKMRDAELKARQMEEAQKTLADWESQNKSKLTARDQADAEVKALQTALDEKKKAVEQSTKTLASANMAHKEAVAALKLSEDKAKEAKAMADREAADTAKKVAEAKATREKEIRAEIEKMQADFQKRMEMLEGQLKAAGDVPSAPSKLPPAPAETRTPAATPRPSSATPTPKPSGRGADAHPTPKPLAAASPVPGDLPLPSGSDATQIPLSTLPAVAPAPSPLSTPTELTLLSKPAPPGPPLKVDKGSGPDTSKATFESSVGLKFAPVGDVLFSVFTVRVGDFELYAKESQFRSTSWRNPGFAQATNHPVVNVSWNDAMAFAKWLTERDRKKGILGKDEFYRLPTDLEWSKAVGLPEESGKTPEARDMGFTDLFPWGTQWPPPPNVGNYTGEETGSDVAIRGYDDGFAWTSPVGSFPANKFGLYDMGGNVWQWCMDDWNAKGKAKVLRGASWYNGALKVSILSSCRVSATAESSTDNYGFRLVKASEELDAKKRK